MSEAERDCGSEACNERALTSNPTNFETNGGNADFVTPYMYWESFAKDIEGGETDVSVGYLSGKVSVSATLRNEELRCGALANLSPEQARTVGHAILEAAHWAEKDGETEEEPDEETGRLDRLRNLVGGNA